jgi:hypothetical protein
MLVKLTPRKKQEYKGSFLLEWEKGRGGGEKEAGEIKRDKTK